MSISLLMCTFSLLMRTSLFSCVPLSTFTALSSWLSHLSQLALSFLRSLLRSLIQDVSRFFFSISLLNDNGNV